MSGLGGVNAHHACRYTYVHSPCQFTCLGLTIQSAGGVTFGMSNLGFQWLAFSGRFQGQMCCRSSPMSFQLLCTCWGSQHLRGKVCYMGMGFRAGVMPAIPKSSAHARSACNSRCKTSAILLQHSHVDVLFIMLIAKASIRGRLHTTAQLTSGSVLHGARAFIRHL